MTTLILVRHGQSMGNLERRFLGHTDLSLAPLGVKQAERVAEHLADMPIDAIYSSDLLRAYQTAEPSARRHALPIVCDSRLREIYAGDWENQSFVYIHETFGDAFRTFRSDIGISCPTNGEPAMEVGRRVYECLVELCERHPESTLLVTSHATAITMFIVTALGLDAAHAKHISLPPNASTTILEYREGTFYLRRYGEDAYLGDLRMTAPPTA